MRASRATARRAARAAARTLSIDAWRSCALLCALASVAAGGCRGRDVDVLVARDAGPTDEDGGGPIDSCARAFAEGRDGAPCVPFETDRCVQTRGCCEAVALCESGTLFRFLDCAGCTECATDGDCGAREWCVASRCLPCEDADPPARCAPPLVPFTRNGCATAVCLPPSECTTDADCGNPARRRCAEGAACGCRVDPSACCVNVCAPADCDPGVPAPEGCVRACNRTRCPTGHCRNVGCRCTPEGWRCDETCAATRRATC